VPPGQPERLVPLQPLVQREPPEPLVPQPRVPLEFRAAEKMQ
jgi:hypothetical protein